MAAFCKNVWLQWHLRAATVTVVRKEGSSGCGNAAAAAALDAVQRLSNKLRDVEQLDGGVPAAAAVQVAARRWRFRARGNAAFQIS